MREWYVRKVREYAERNMGRKHYAFVAGIIKKIRSYPGGKPRADALLVDFRFRYQKRHAMMGELSGL